MKNKSMIDGPYLITVIKPDGSEITKTYTNINSPTLVDLSTSEAGVNPTPLEHDLLVRRIDAVEDAVRGLAHSEEGEKEAKELKTTFGGEVRLPGFTFFWKREIKE
jgi:hypothetical protein